MEIKNETHREMLILYTEGLKYAEIAKRLDLKIGTIMSGLARAKKSVADCVKRKLKNEL